MNYRKQIFALTVGYITHSNMTGYSLYTDIVYEIIGAAMTVYRELWWGLLEPIYNEALHLELQENGIDNYSEQTINCYYKGQLLAKQYRIDLLVGNIVVELKACEELSTPHRLQLFNYLRLTKKPIGLLINFSHHGLQGERYGYDLRTNECHLLDKNMKIIPK